MGDSSLLYAFGQTVHDRPLPFIRAEVYDSLLTAVVICDPFDLLYHEHQVVDPFLFQEIMVKMSIERKQDGRTLGREGTWHFNSRVIIQTHPLQEQRGVDKIKNKLVIRNQNITKYKIFDYLNALLALNLDDTELIKRIERI